MRIDTYRHSLSKSLILVVTLFMQSRVYHYSMANYVYILKKGMDVTPGGKDEGMVPPDQRLEEAVDLDRRVALLVETTSYVTFAYVAQVGMSGRSS
jgi:dynein heavy chain